MTKRMSRKAGRSIDRPLTDRERILMTIIDRLSSTMMLRAHPPHLNWSSDYYKSDDGGIGYVHFAPWKKPEPGDLVLANTGHVSEWKIGWYVEKADGIGGAVIREIGTDRLCNYGNESFTPILGMAPLALLESDQRSFYVKVQRAFAKGDEYLYRFGGLRFDGAEAVITIREAFGGLGAPTVPFEVRLPWTKRTPIAAILKAMRDAGYGTKDFRPEGWMPPAKAEPVTG